MSTTSATQNRPSFPQVPLYGAAALVGFALCAAVFGRMTGSGVEPPTAPVTAERNLRFADRADGAVIVSLGDSGQLVDVMTGQNGFLRGTLRGFARTRRAEGVGPIPPLRLTGYGDGRLVLFDPATGRHVELEAFGSENEAVFVRLLTKKPSVASTSTPGFTQTASAAPVKF
jgi:putative photosynthetic complex assembly protein